MSSADRDPSHHRGSTPSTFIPPIYEAIHRRNPEETRRQIAVHLVETKDQLLAHQPAHASAANLEIFLKRN